MSSNCQKELQAWWRKLEGLQQENVLLKHKVADILKFDVDRIAIDKVERYLASFIEKDAILAILRRDIAQEMKADGYSTQTGVKDMLSKKRTDLRKDIAQIESAFYKLKSDFHHYITQLSPAA